VNSYQEKWYQTLIQHRAIAVIRAHSLDDGLSMAQAVADGGIKLIEVTWNSVEADILIRKLRHNLSDCLIGVGTILDVQSLSLALDAGAQFVFSPHTDLDLIKITNQVKIPVIPGALSPTEIVTAWQNGADCVKVFPINNLGGVSYLQSLRGPLAQIPLIPTGGVTIDNAGYFIKFGAIAVGLSGGLFSPEAVKNKDWSLITEKAQLLFDSLIGVI
jgi:2-dehydro-3-deoxyphosphogluconate aldolase/(4S)-4-hydroxy-2-oxoglutarate aldolase